MGWQTFRIPRLLVLIALFTLVVPLAPTAVGFAADDLYPGAPAIAASPDLSQIPVRVEPSAASPEVVWLDHGASLEILDGPTVSIIDGALWYQVRALGQIGFIPALNVDRASLAMPEVTVPEEPVPELPPVVGQGVIFNTAGGTVACYAGPQWDSLQLTSFVEGDVVELTGWLDIDFQPVICAGQAGFVPAQFIADPASLITPVPTEVFVAPTSTEVAVTSEPAQPIETAIPAEPIETETPIAQEDPVETEEPVVNAPPVETEEPVATDEPVASDSTPIATQESVTQTEAVSTAVASSNAYVANTGGASLRCRSGASLESAIITFLPFGTAVPLRGPVEGDWQPVLCAGQPGYVAAQYLAEGSGAAEDMVEAAAISGSSGYVQNTDGDGVRCRATGSLSGTVIAVLPEGTWVRSRGAPQGVWQPVECAGRNGWVHVDYLGDASPGSGTSSTGQPATVSGTNGDGVRLRSAASYSGPVIAVLAEGTAVTLRSGSTGGWTAVIYGGSNGFIYSEFLSVGGGGSGVGNTNLSTGSNARVFDTLNFRSSPSYSGGVMGVAPIGTVVRIIGQPSSGFYPVRWGSTDGYMHGDYLTWTSNPLSSGGPTSGGGAGTGAGSASGQAMVDYAMRYLGYPYVWATHGPNSFDCSGFTYWVTLNVLGINIGAGTWTQWGTGSPVQYGNLRPGDLVFFQNTFTTGLSHVGLYIGGDQFIHAENENTGVRISSLSSNYYSTRYLGARRLV